MTLALLSLFIVLFVALLLPILSLVQRKSPPRFRLIPAFRELRRSVDLSIEDGKQVHLSLGRGNLLSLQGASGLASLGMWRHLAAQAAVGDRPPLITAGEGGLVILSQDTTRTAYRAALAEELYHPLVARLGGLSPFAYAASILPLLQEKRISTHVFLGNFGAESLLLAEAAGRNQAFFVAASDDLAAQAGLFALAPHPLLGEEIFAAAAYLGAGPSHQASLSAQDALRWILILVLLILPALKFLGVF
ncbi:MAG: DUF6754 domain-containing protein [Anaerolineales bacterium]